MRLLLDPAGMGLHGGTKEGVMCMEANSLTLQISGQPVAVRFCVKPTNGLKDTIIDILTGALGARISIEDEETDGGDSDPTSAPAVKCAEAEARTFDGAAAS